MPNKKTVVITSHPVTQFGFARVSRPIIDMLIDTFGYTNENLLILDTSKIRELPTHYREIRVVSMTSNGTIAQIMPSVVSDYQPKLVICFGDIWDHFHIYNLKKSLGFDLVYYANVESEHIPQKLAIDSGALMFHEEYKKVDHLLAYSKFGAIELAKVVEHDVPYIYHFVDHGIFHPLEGFDRKSVFKSVPSDAFIVSTVAVNGFRKSLDMICAGFAEFLTRLSPVERAKTYLYLHTNMTGTVGWDIKELTDMFGISNNVLLNHGISQYGKFVTDEELNKIYNASDVFINLSRGEGFGLGLIEACAVGCRIVFLDYATPSETMKDEDGRVPVAIREVRPNNVTNFSALPDPKVVGQKLADIRHQKYRIKGRYSKVVSANIELAKKFDRVPIMAEWEKFLRPIVEKQPPKVSIGIQRL